MNRDLFIRTVALTSAFGVFYRESALAGELILATNVILLQFLAWMSYLIDGFAFASESLVGRFYGARDRLGLFRSIRYVFIWAFVLAVLISIIYAISLDFSPSSEELYPNLRNRLFRERRHATATPDLP